MKNFCKLVENKVVKNNSKCNRIQMVFMRKDST